MVKVKKKKFNPKNKERVWMLQEKIGRKGQSGIHGRCRYRPENFRDLWINNTILDHNFSFLEEQNPICKGSTQTCSQSDEDWSVKRSVTFRSGFERI